MKIVLLVGSLFLSIAAFGQGSVVTTSAEQAAKSKANVEKIGVRGDLTIKITRGETYHGFVTKIDSDSFEMTEIDLNANLTIRFDEVKSVENGYFPKGPLGNRPSRKQRKFGKLILIGLAAEVAVVVVLGVKEVKIRDRDPQVISPR